MHDRLTRVYYTAVQWQVFKRQQWAVLKLQQQAVQLHFVHLAIGLLGSWALGLLLLGSWVLRVLALFVIAVSASTPC
jgi:hypothetical protein